MGFYPTGRGFDSLPGYQNIFVNAFSLNSGFNPLKIGYSGVRLFISS
jgi:hypothetical protein